MEPDSKPRYIFPFSPDNVAEILREYDLGRNAYSKQGWQEVSSRFGGLRVELEYFTLDLFDAPSALPKIAKATGRGDDFVDGQIAAARDLTVRLHAAALSADVSDPLAQQVVREIGYVVRWFEGFP